MSHSILPRRFCVAIQLALASFVTLSNVAVAAPGPGVGNIDCGDDEYFKPFAFIENTTSGPNGTNVAIVVRGYFMTVFAPDSGKTPGEIGIYDLSDPKSPREVRHVENGDTNAFREAHSLPVAIIDGKHYVAFQTSSGVQFWDFTDPLTARRIGSIDLPGVTGGDYDNASWQTVWQGRYLYVAGANRGIYVVDAADPTRPELLHQVPTSATGGFRVGPLFAVGDYLVISNMDQGGAYAILDISQPDAPALLSQSGGAPRMYAIVVGGNDRFYTAGRDGDFLTHSFEDPTNITLVKHAAIGQDQLYAAAQEHFVFLGRQNNVVKVDVADEQNPVVVGEGNLGRSNPDHGQVTPLGNLLFIGNDHGTGSALFCHQRGRDTTPLTLQTSYPKANSTGVDPRSRIGLVFSDAVDLDTVNQQTVTVRPLGGEPLEGIYSYAFNTLSFGPNVPFEADTTYELVLAKDGLSDALGNAVSQEVLVRFSTGDTIDEPPPPPPPAATGGAPNASGGSTSLPEPNEPMPGTGGAAPTQQAGGCSWTTLSISSSTTPAWLVASCLLLGARRRAQRR